MNPVTNTSYVFTLLRFFFFRRMMKERKSTLWLWNSSQRHFLKSKLWSLQYFRRQQIRNYVEKAGAQEQQKGQTLRQFWAETLCVIDAENNTIGFNFVFPPSFFHFCISHPLTYLTPRYFCIERISSFPFNSFNLLFSCAFFFLLFSSCGWIKVSFISAAGFPPV